MDEKTFLKSARWRRKRESILKRDGYICQECKRYGRLRHADVVHHIQHFSDRPDLALAPSNLISLCNACHNKAHPEKAQAMVGRK